MKLFELFEDGPIDAIGRKLKVKTTRGEPDLRKAPEWATHVGQTPTGAYHWLSNETPVETDDSDKYFPHAERTEFTGYIGYEANPGVYPVRNINEARHDAPTGDRITTDENPLISNYENGSMAGHLNLKTFMSIYGISQKYQKALADAVVQEGPGKEIRVPDEMLIHRAGEYRESGIKRKPPVLTIELSKHHEADKEESELGEAKSDSFRRKFNKAFWWDQYSDPKDVMKRVRDMDDETLIRFANKGWDDHQTTSDGSPADLQQKLIRRELKRRFGVTPKGKLDKMKEPMTVEGEGGEQHLYMVRCVGNFWGGKYYETGIDSIVVAASSPDEAVQIAKSNTDAIVDHFHNKKLGARKRPALRRADNKVRVTDNAKELKQAEWYKTLTSDGTFGPVDVSQGLEEAGREVKQNWFETLNAALESEGLLSTWDMTMDPISYGENRSYNAYDDAGECRHISIYRETDGRYERPVHYPSKMCGERVEEEIVPYDEKEGNFPGKDEYYDNETGQIFNADEIEFDPESGTYREKEPEPREPVTSYDDDDYETLDYDEFTKGAKVVDPGKKMKAIGMFGDVAAGGGDPVDYIMSTLGLSMEEIDAIAQEQGFEDAWAWAESYQEDMEFESIMSLNKRLNK